MNSYKIISGTAMAVILGFGSILSAFFVSKIDIGSKLILVFLGCIFVWLGLRFSRG